MTPDCHDKTSHRLRIRDQDRVLGKHGAAESHCRIAAGNAGPLSRAIATSADSTESTHASTSTFRNDLCSITFHLVVSVLLRISRRLHDPKCLVRRAAGRTQDGREIDGCLTPAVYIFRARLAGCISSAVPADEPPGCARSANRARRAGCPWSRLEGPGLPPASWALVHRYTMASALPCATLICMHAGRADSPSCQPGTGA
jgi:hypothetical protein